MKKIGIFTAMLMLLVFSVLVTGCGDDRKKIVPPEPDNTAMEVAEHPEVDIFFDASLSMAGYTTIPGGNLYRQLPDELMDVGNSLGEIHFYSFGSSVVELKGNDYRKFINPDAYVELENSIKNVIDSATPEHLTVVVTDLFETDAAWSAISARLQDKYFKKKYSVAIIGLKSPFNGTIYDVGLDSAKFNYNSGNDINKYRPVYMLVMGPDTHVNSFMKSCIEKHVGSGMLNYVKMSSTLMANRPADVTDMEEVSITNAVEQEKLSLPEGTRAVEYKLTTDDGEVEIVRNFKYVSDDYGCILDYSKIKPDVQLYYLDEEDGAWKSASAEKFSVISTPDGETPGTYNISVKFIPKEALKEGAINSVMVRLVPEYDGLILPDWITEWNLPPVVAADPASFDGGKTVNLLRTAVSLKDSVLAAGKPSLINLEMYFDQR